jgi:hypothetical protein
MKQKIALKDKKKDFRKQINGKFNNIGSAAEKIEINYCRAFT